MLAAKAVLHPLAVVAIDAATVYLCAFILWSSAGTTVVDGSTYGLAACGTVAFLGLALRSFIGSRSSLMMRKTTSAGQQGIILTGHGLLLIGVTVAWKYTDLYFLGWLACFAGAYLAIGSLWQLLATLINDRQARYPPNRTGIRHGKRTQIKALTMLVGAAMGIIVIVVTAPIHGWDLQILNTLIVLLSGAALLSAAAVHFLAAINGTSATLKTSKKPTIT